MIYFHYIILFCLFYLLVFYFSFFKHAWFLVIQVELWEWENWRSINYGVLLAGVLVTPWIIVFWEREFGHSYLMIEFLLKREYCIFIVEFPILIVVEDTFIPYDQFFNSMIEWNCAGSIQTKVTCFHHICKGNVQFIYALFKLHQQTNVELLYDMVCIVRFSSRICHPSSKMTRIN